MKGILIVDDSPILRNSLRLLFQREGLEVCGEAADGQDAVAKALRLKPEIIVLDLAMPVMNGITAGRIVKQLLPSVTLILFSLSADLLSPEELASAGFSAAISKGHAETLVAKAQSLLAAA